jgi:hypothetical protein
MMECWGIPTTGKLALFRTISPSLARHPPDVPSCPSLALFRTIAPASAGPLFGIGFVWYDRPARAGGGTSVFNSQSAIRNRRIGFVSPPPFACPIHHNSFPIKNLPLTPRRGQLALFGQEVPSVTRQWSSVPPKWIGFVSHTRLPQRARSRIPQLSQVWLCFA